MGVSKAHGDDRNDAPARLPSRSSPLGIRVNVNRELVRIEHEAMPQMPTEGHSALLQKRFRPHPFVDRNITYNQFAGVITQRLPVSMLVLKDDANAVDEPSEMVLGEE
jgi:hypothetical protein